MEFDSELAKEIASGSHAAMELLIDRHGERLRRTIGRLTAWGPQVDDLLQETLIRAWKYAPNYRADGPFDKWLVSIAFRVCQDHQRGVRRIWTVLHDFWIHANQVADPGKIIQQPATASDEWDQLQQAMQRLSARDRELLVMVHIEHWSHEELAKHLNIAEETLHVRLHRARNRLKKLIAI